VAQSKSCGKGEFVKVLKNIFRTCGVVGALALAGCGGENGAETANSSAAGNAASAENKPFQAALLTPGDINDAGWNQLANEGLQAVKKELNAETAHQVTKNTADHQAALADFGDRKFNVVFCHGFEYGERVLQAAPQFPGTKYFVMSGDVKKEPNVASLALYLEDATYLLGMTAGGMTKSNVIGCIGGQKFPAVAAAFEAFEKGAKEVNPKVTVKTVYLNSWEDQGLGKEAANSLIAQKADFLIHNADQAGKGMFDAAKTAKGVMVFGTNRDQNDVAPNITLGSAVIEMPHIFVEFARGVKENNFQAAIVPLTMANQSIGAHWNPKLKSKIPPALMKKIDAAEAQIKAGKLPTSRRLATGKG
jgi:basic membrane protein A